MEPEFKHIREFVIYRLKHPAEADECLRYIEVMLWVAAPLILAFSWINFHHGHQTLALIELGIGLVFTPLLFVVRKPSLLPWIKAIFTLAMLILFPTLVIDGGVENTGIYWMQVFPIAALLAGGLRAGSLVILAVLAIMLGAYFLSTQGLLAFPYSPYQLTIALVSFLTFGTMSFCLVAIQEFNTHKLKLANRRLTEADDELRRAHAELEVQVAERTANLARAKKQLEQEVEQKEQALEQLRATQEKFFHAQKMEAIGTLVGGIAHDFNNMLSGITANLYLVKARMQDAASIERLEKVDTLIMHAADMIRQMLTFARKDQIQLREFEFRGFLKEAFKLARVSISESIRVNLSLPADELYIRGDATQLQQVLMNLMNNARDALEGRPNPEIQVSLRSFVPDETFRREHPEQKSRRYAVLSVRDNGMGIPEEKIDQIFEPFFTTKSVGRGTGLGLAMIYGAVESHGGIIEVKSRVGHGTTFLIYLPIVTQVGSGLPDTGHSTIVKGRGETILLVDDDEYSRSANADVLQSLNYKVIEAVNGVEAVRLYQQHGRAIDLVLMDVVMPEMGGADAARRIRKLDPDAGIIFLTGYDKDRTLDGDITGEWENIITKPLSIEKLSNTIHRFFLRQLTKTHP